jgi:hypothetical protein
MRKAHVLYADEDLCLDLDNTIYALDSTTIDLSLTLFPWVNYRQTKVGIKIHTQIEVRGPIPTCIHITEARQHDVGGSTAFCSNPVPVPRSLLRRLSYSMKSKANRMKPYRPMLEDQSYWEVIFKH